MRWWLINVVPWLLLAVIGGYLLWRLLRFCRWWLAVGITAVIALPVVGIWSFNPIEGLGIVYFFGFVIAGDVMIALIRFIWRRHHWHQFSVWLCRTMVVPCLCAVILTTVGVINAQTIVATRYHVTTAKTLRAEGYQIAWLSDIHYDDTRRASLQATADQISAAGYDIIIFGGDIVDEHTTAAEMQTVWQILGAIQCRIGRYFVFGNHDIQPDNLVPDYTAEQLTATITAAGVTVLTDTVVPINDDLMLVGRQDQSTRGRTAVEKLLQNVDHERVIVMADHQPDQLLRKAAAGVDLQISGHTHGGQLFPAGLIMQIIHPNRQLYGRANFDGMTSITSSGVFGSHPVRTEAKAEYVVINLQSAH